MKKNNNKQCVVQKDSNISNKTKKRFIWGAVSSILLLVLILFGILKINSYNKSDSKKMLDKYNEFYNSNDYKIICYYDGTKNDSEIIFELDYLTQISKQYKIDYVGIDSSIINEKNQNKIKKQLGIEGISPSIVIVKNKKVVAQQEGYIENNRIVDLLVSAKVLEKGSKYKAVDNLNFIDYKDYLEILEDKDINVVVVGQSACKYCNSVKPILNNISKAYKIDINYLNVSEQNNDDLKEFFKELPDKGFESKTLVENETFNMPTVLIIKKGKVISYLENQHTLEEYVSFFKKNDVIE